MTAIFVKVGIEDLNSDLATFVRTGVIVVGLAVMLLAAGQFQVPANAWRSSVFLILSGLAPRGFATFGLSS